MLDLDIFLQNYIASICNRCTGTHTHHNGDILASINCDTIQELLKECNNSALDYFYKNKNQVFIRHGLEKPHLSNYQYNVIFPPKNSYHDINAAMNQIDYYAIELDQPPFLYCSNHGNLYGSPWYYCGGYMALKDFKGTLKLSGDRDHYYAHSNHKTQDWIYVYDDLDYKIEKYNPDINYKDLEDSINELKNSELISIHRNTIKKFFHLITLIENIIEANKLCL